jgi:hypothetical protein
MPGDSQRERNLLRAALGPGNDCPPVEQLERLAATDPAGLKQHVDACAYCRTELDLLHKFQAAEPSCPTEAADLEAIAGQLRARGRDILKPRRHWWQDLFAGGWMRPAFGIAALLLIAVVNIEVRRSSHPALNPVNGAADVYRSHSLTALAPSGDLNAAPHEFHWERVDGAARYQLRLMEVDGNELWQASTSDTRLAIPSDVASGIVPAKTLTWQVAAMDSADRKIAESDIVRFRLASAIPSR